MMKSPKLALFFFLFVLSLVFYFYENKSESLVKIIIGFISLVFGGLLANELHRILTNKIVLPAEANRMMRVRLLRFPLLVRKEVESYSRKLDPCIKKRALGKENRPDYVSSELSYLFLYNFIKQNRITALTGNAGIGKSVLVKRIVLDLAEEASSDLSKPIPLLLDCAAWKANYRGLGEWIVEQVEKNSETANESKDAILALLAEGGFIVLLDGLDEIEDRYRRNFISSLIDIFSSSSASVIVTSRPLAYEQNFSELKTENIFTLTSLKSDQIISNLSDKPEFDDFRHDYFNDKYESLREILKTPLMLKMFIDTAKSIGFNEFANGNSKEIRDIILLRYVQNSLSRKSNSSNLQYRKELFWLKNLAKGMNYPVFWIEDIQHRWLKINSELPWFSRLQLEIFSWFWHVYPAVFSITLILLMYGVNIHLGYNFITAVYLFLFILGFFWSRKTLTTTTTKEKVKGFNSTIPEEIEFFKSHRFKMPEFRDEFRKSFKSQFGTGSFKNIVWFIMTGILTIIYSIIYKLLLQYAILLGVVIYLMPAITGGFYGVFKGFISPNKKKRINSGEILEYEKCGIESNIKTIGSYAI